MKPEFFCSPLGNSDRIFRSMSLRSDLHGVVFSIRSCPSEGHRSSLPGGTSKPETQTTASDARGGHPWQPFPSRSNIESAPSPSIAHTPTRSHSMTNRACSKCRKEFQPGDSILKALDKDWHASCFVCSGCQKPFSGGSCVIEGGLPMHDECARKRFEQEAGSCEACHKSLGHGEPILELGNGKKYHHACFVCAECGKPFDGDNSTSHHVQKDGKPYHLDCASATNTAYYATKKALHENKNCAKCGKAFTSGVRVVPNLGSFHPHCFVCTTCNRELHGKYYVHPNTKKPSCKACIDGMANE